MNASTIPAPVAARATPPAPYARPSTASPIDLHLDANEGPRSAFDVDIARVAAEVGPEAIRRYPDSSVLDQLIAQRWNVPSSRVIVTAGGDEAIDRICRVTLAPGRELLVPVPTFEMIPRFARQAGAEVVTVAWDDERYPVQRVLGRITERTALIAVVSPNNPTGAVAAARDVERLAQAAPDALVLVDAAYAEFADEDLTAVSLALPNAIVVRTFSKSFAMAGLRVGYAIGSERVIRAMRSAGSPFPVSGIGLAVAERAFTAASVTQAAAIRAVRSERERLSALLEQLGARPRPTHGNFVLAEFQDAEWSWRALAGLGIGVRRFAAGSGLERSLRITCPGDEAAFDRLCRGLRAAVRPRALLLDMDGVIADVSESYRRAIRLTAESFGATLGPGDIIAAKAEGNANNDWLLTRRLLASRGIDVPLADVTARFEALCHGINGEPGLAAAEKLIPARAVLDRLAAKVPLAIVTGRPRQDCELFLARFALKSLFRVVVCMEDAPAKPDPGAVRLAMERLGVEAAWMVGDTPDDIVAARRAGVVPIGILPPGGAGDERRDMALAIERSGSARLLDSLEELEDMLP
ncbi:MAG: TIGR01548 family HAD-type hydrolase [Phycisphaerae bacterium]|jgi:histidinol-phosphate aminotransferase